MKAWWAEAGATRIFLIFRYKVLSVRFQWRCRNCVWKNCKITNIIEKRNQRRIHWKSAARTLETELYFYFSSFVISNAKLNQTTTHPTPNQSNVTTHQHHQCRFSNRPVFHISRWWWLHSFLRLFREPRGIIFFSISDVGFLWFLPWVLTFW